MLDCLKDDLRYKTNIWLTYKSSLTYLRNLDKFVCLFWFGLDSKIGKYENI